jgi:two-component system chemotaxis response regulator CheY
MKIAIIDDDPLCHFLHRKLIQTVSIEHQILRYNNGLEAMEFLILNMGRPELLPEVILLDINMPIMNGWQFLEKLRLLMPSGYAPEIYLVSSSTDTRDAESAAQYPELRAFLQKPLTKTQVSQILNGDSVSIEIPSYKSNDWLSSYVPLSNPAHPFT